jgi:TonB family protein
MRMLALALPLIFLATPAAAQTLFGWSGSWEIRQQGGVCMMRHIAKDAAGTRIEFSKRVIDDGNLLLTLSGIGWPYAGGNEYALQFAADGELLANHPGWGIEDGPGRGGVQQWIYRDTPTRLLAARSIVLREISPKRDGPGFRMPPAMLAEQDLERCLADLRSREAGSGSPAVNPPRVRGVLDTLITDDDYPGAARRTGQSGRVKVRLTIGVYGFARDCTVLESSGSETLDTRTCTLYRRRARFEPATDALDHPTLGSYEIVRTWVLPPPQPPRYPGS